jgi:outer membrane receptor protein involved in Fe transport
MAANRSPGRGVALALSVVASSVSLVSPAQAAPRYRISVSAGRLGDALVAIGSQTGTSIGVADPALANERVRSLDGTYTVEQALQRLLKGTSARYATIDSRTIRVVRRPPSSPIARKSARPSRPAPRADPPPRPPPAPPRETAQDIIVTATRWPLPLDSYAGSASILWSDDMTRGGGPTGTENLTDRLTTLTSTHLGPGRNKVFIRGLVDSSLRGPLQLTSGEYLGEARLGYSAPDPDLRLHDIARVEVLAGPQGTLYGAGSLGGIMKIVPNAPDLDRLEGEAAAGTSLTWHGNPGADLSGVLNAPIAEGQLAVRLSGYAVAEGGYIDGVRHGLPDVRDVNDVRTIGGRAALRGVAGGLTFDLSANAQLILGDDAQYAEPSARKGSGSLIRRAERALPFHSNHFSGGLVASRNWGDKRFLLALSMARQDTAERYASHLQENPPGLIATDSALASGEARLSQLRGDGSGWLVGASMLGNRWRQRRERVSSIADFERTFEIVERTFAGNSTFDLSLFGEWVARIFPAVAVTLGGRATYSSLSTDASDFEVMPIDDGGASLPGEGDARRRQLTFLPSAGATAEISRGWLVYARYQESFRPGGYASFTTQFQKYKADRLGSAEAGLRVGTPGRGRFDAAVAVVFTRWNDVQADILNLVGDPVIVNIGNARIYTLDVALGWRPLPGVAFSAGAVYNHSRLSLQPGIDFGARRELPYAAPVNGRVAAEYEFAAIRGVKMRISGSARHVGRSVLTTGLKFARIQGNWTDTTASIEARTSRHTISLGVTNLLDAKGNRFSFGSPFSVFENVFTTPLRPRVVRLGWGVRF